MVYIHSIGLGSSVPRPQPGGKRIRGCCQKGDRASLGRLFRELEKAGVSICLAAQSHIRMTPFPACERAALLLRHEFAGPLPLRPHPWRAGPFPGNRAVHSWSWEGQGEERVHLVAPSSTMASCLPPSGLGVPGAAPVYCPKS